MIGLGNSISDLFTEFMDFLTTNFEKLQNKQACRFPIGECSRAEIFPKINKRTCTIIKDVRLRSVVYISKDEKIYFGL